MSTILPASEVTLSKIVTLLQSAYFECSIQGEIQQQWLEIDSATGAKITLIVTPQAIRLRALACEGLSDDPACAFAFANWLNHFHPCFKLLVADDGTGYAAAELAHAQGLLPVQLISAVRHLESMIYVVRDAAVHWKNAASKRQEKIAEGILASNGHWLYAADRESGDVLRDADGRAILSNAGKLVSGFVEQAEQCGVKDLAVQWAVANAMLHCLLQAQKSVTETAASEN